MSVVRPGGCCSWAGNPPSFVVSFAAASAMVSRSVMPSTVPGGAETSIPSLGWAAVHTGGVEINIGADVIRLGQLLKYANLVSDGAAAKALIADGAVQVDGAVETRRGRQVAVGAVVEVDLPDGLHEVRVTR